MSQNKSPTGPLSRRAYTVAVAGAGNAAANAVTEVPLAGLPPKMAQPGNVAVISPAAAFPATLAVGTGRITTAGTVRCPVINPTGAPIAIPDGDYRVVVYDDSEDP